MAPALPSNNPWIGQQTSPQVAAAPVAPQANPQPTTQPGWQPSGAATAPPTAQALAQQQLVPASQAPPVALEGYCPVTLLESRQWQKANTEFGAIHRGRTYLFRSAAEQTKFLADPDRYSPVLSGLDAVAFAQRGEKVEGKRSYGLTYNKQIYLFADEASLKAFEASPQVFAGAAHQAMLQIETTQKYR
jgi:YHS domain-containing protein